MTKTIRVRVAVNAAPEGVYAACAEPDQVMRWLAEHAEIDIPGGSYALWGKSIPGATDGNQGHMRLIDAVPGSRLGFDWTLRGDETTVTMTFEPQDDGTLVTLEHTGITAHEWAWTIASFWSTAAENLRAWVERGATGPRFDFRTLEAGDIHLSVEIDAPAGDVFNAITDPGLVARWMGSDNVTIEPEAGGDYDVGGWDTDGPVKIVDLDPGRQLAYSWRSDSIGYETLVTWELEGSGGKTRLNLFHSGFAPDDRHDSYRTGWHNFLVQIKYLVERGDTWCPVEWEVADAFLA